MSSIEADELAMLEAAHIGDRHLVELMCARLAQTHPPAPQLPLFRAAADGRINLVQFENADAVWPTASIEKLRKPTVIVIGADLGQGDDPGPADWRCAKRLRWWAAGAIVHGAAGEPEHYRLAVAAAEQFRRIALIECAAHQIEPWVDYLKCPRTLTIVPRSGVHPKSPAPNA